MNNIRMFLFYFISLTFLISGCAGFSKKEPAIAPQNVKNELTKIEIDLNSGAQKRAIQRLQKIINLHANTDVADDAAIMLGQVYFKQNDFENSYRSFISVINSEYFSPREVDAAIGAGKALYKLGRYDEALSLTSRAAKISPLSPETITEIYTLRYNLQAQLGDKLDSLRSLVYLTNNAADADQRERFRIKALEYVDTQLNESELESVANNSEYSFVRTTALLRVGISYFDQRDHTRAESFLRTVVSTAPGTDSSDTAENYLQQIMARRRVEPYTIGAVLPLTGKHAAIAQKTLRGLQMGLGISGNSPSPFRIAVIDSEANADVARRAAERLVIEDSVIAIVGDLLSKTAEPVARKADELGVPIIGLSQKSGLTSAGTNVFRNALTSHAIVKELVQTAMDKHGMKRFAILFPNDAYGIEYANLFWDEVLSRGGQITSAQVYSTEEKDFNGPISRLLGTYYLEDRADEYSYLIRTWYSEQKTITSRVTPPTDLLQPIIDFDAIFIPDGVKALGQIASMLVFNDVKNVRLLGTNLWNNSTLVDRGTSLIENSLFIDAKTSVDNSFEKTNFYREYKSFFGEAPSAFEAQAYDTGLAIRSAIDRGAKSRVALRDALAGLSGFPGALGNIRVTEDREFTRPLTVLTVREGKIQISTGPMTQQIK
jgi:ABC-type branched-subunit amino acid transport system substrate-binding protein